MRNIILYIQKNDFSAFLLMLALASITLGPLTWLAPVYPLAIMGGCAVVLCKGVKKISLMILIFLSGCALSILLADPLPVFKPWMRLSYFILLLTVFSPLLQSKKINKFRINVFLWIMRLSIFIGLTSFFLYFMGINYNKYVVFSDQQNSIFPTGSFSGLTIHSMLLGPISGIAFVYMFYKILSSLLTWNNKLKKYELLLIFTSLGSLFLSSSRGALLSTMGATLYLIFLFFKHRPKQLVRILGCIILLGCAIYPVSEYLFSGMIAKQQANVNSGGTFSSREKLWHDRKLEFLNSPIYGVGFASQRAISFSSSLKTGLIEPGTSYGAVFAMTGLLGGIPFLCLLFYNTFKNSSNQYCLRPVPVSPAQPILIFFLIHLIVEGYVLSAGSPLAAIFWCSLGAASAYRNKNCPAHMQIQLLR